MNKKDFILAAFSGVLLILIFPSPNIQWLGWICLVPLLAAAHKKDPVQGFLLGCLSGSIFQCGLIYWVTVSMTQYGNLPVVLSIGILILFSIFLSLFIAIPVYLCCYVQMILKIGFTLTLPFLWTASEYIKSWILTGFPWENLGYSQFQVLPMIQAADVTGVYGISFLIVLTNCSIFTCLHSLLTKKRLPYAELAFTVLAVAVTCAYGYKRLQTYQTPQGNSIAVTIIQPNIPQDLKWSPAYLDETMATYRRLTLASRLDRPDLVVWPESATPFFYQSEETYTKVVEATVKDSGAYLLFGSPSWEPFLDTTKYYNSAFLISPANKIEGKYDKVHLVPYGEYVPLKELFPFINKMVAGIGDFSPGSTIKNITLPVPACDFATLICYEIIFPDLVRKFVKKGAHFIVNITNDAWFGRTSAPEQHLSMSVMRAVENKRYVVRAANTGISAYVHPTGTILKQSKLFTEEVLPAIIYCSEKQTFYSLYGDIFALLCCTMGCGYIFAARVKRKKS